MPIITRDYPTLFEMHPEGTEPPAAQRAITPGCLLPVPNNEVIDVKRCMSILGLGDNKVMMFALLRKGRIENFRLGNSQRISIPYDSVVAFCNQLRLDFAIPDRRARLAPGRRHRDADLLPFPLAETVTVKEVMSGLDIGKDVAFKLIEEGQFEAYQLMKNSQWRISKTSLFRYRDRKRDALQAMRAASEKQARRPQR